MFYLKLRWSAYKRWNKLPYELHQPIMAVIVTSILHERMGEENIDLSRCIFSFSFGTKHSDHFRNMDTFSTSNEKAMFQQGHYVNAPCDGNICRGQVIDYYDEPYRLSIRFDDDKTVRKVKADDCKFLSRTVQLCEKVTVPFSGFYTDSNGEQVEVENMRRFGTVVTID